MDAATRTIQGRKRGITMRKETAIRKFNEFYDKAVKLSYVEKPISWALYQTWKWSDENEKSRIAEARNKYGRCRVSN